MREVQNSFCKANGKEKGIIGRDNYEKIGDDEDANAYIVRYPFSIYWNALCRWDLIPSGRGENGNAVSMAAYVQRACRFIHEHNDPENRWVGFDRGERRFSHLRNRSGLSPSEREFIKARMIGALPDTLLGPMVENGFDAKSFLPDSLTSEAIAGVPLKKVSATIREAVGDMVFFTAFMRTAFAAYNALLNLDAHLEEFRRSLDDFRKKYPDAAEAGARLAGMKKRIDANNDGGAAAFLDRWLEQCYAAGDALVPDLVSIAEREYAKKKRDRAKILKAWGGDRRNFELMKDIRWDSENRDFPVLTPEKDWIGMDVLDYRWKVTSRLADDLLNDNYSEDNSNDGQ